MFSARALAMLFAALAAGSGRAAAADEPGMAALEADEPGIAASVASSAAPARGPILRIDAAFGLSSLLADPDVGEGYGGGLSVVYGMRHRMGAELSVFVANNPYQGPIAELGGFPSFLAGNISVGPNVQLTRPGARLSITLEALIGAYVIVPPVLVQDPAWTLGFAGGATLLYRFTRWLGVGLKVRYHLFNVANIAGPALIDRKAFDALGVIDRFEVPAYVAFCI